MSSCWAKDDTRDTKEGRDRQARVARPDDSDNRITRDDADIS